MFTECGPLAELCQISLRCGGTKSLSLRPFVTTLYEADGRARQGNKDFGTATLLYILWDFTVSNLAQIGLCVGRD